MSEEKKFYLHIPIKKELLDRIDNYKFEARFDSRAEAVRFLLDWALRKNPKP